MMKDRYRDPYDLVLLLMIKEEKCLIAFYIDLHHNPNLSAI